MLVAEFLQLIVVGGVVELVGGLARVEGGLLGLEVREAQARRGDKRVGGQDLLVLGRVRLEELVVLGLLLGERLGSGVVLGAHARELLARLGEGLRGRAFL